MRIAKPLSRKNIRKIANMIREMCGKSDELYFDIVRFTECILPQICPDFKFIVCTMEEMGTNEGLTNTHNGIMRIREDVYYGACNGNGRDRFTIAHEVGHYLLHNNDSISLARNKGEIVPYEDPEWQANAFAGELLIPAKLVKGLSYQEISEKCGVSYEAAKYQLSKI